jgi:hypothetical protein
MRAIPMSSHNKMNLVPRRLDQTEIGHGCFLNAEGTAHDLVNNDNSLLIWDENLSSIASLAGGRCAPSGGSPIRSRAQR